MQIAIFTFNGFAENTYVLYDETKECIIIDPGCNSDAERNALDTFVQEQGLTPVKLVQTHCHIDHVLGNKHVAETYNVEIYAHQGEKIVLDSCQMVSQMYGVKYELSPDIAHFIDEGDTVTFGNTSLEVYYTPGHSPASLSYFHRETKQLIAGDVLFQGSIGRTDLPGGDMTTLLDSIKTKYYPLGDDVIVYPGHGSSTTIGEEKMSNPFLR